MTAHDKLREAAFRLLRWDETNGRSDPRTREEVVEMVRDALREPDPAPDDALRELMIRMTKQSVPAKQLPPENYAVDMGWLANEVDRLRRDPAPPSAASSESTIINMPTCEQCGAVMTMGRRREDGAWLLIAECLPCDAKRHAPKPEPDAASSDHLPDAGKKVVAPAQPADAAPQPVSEPYKLPDVIGWWCDTVEKMGSADITDPCDDIDVAAYLRSLPAKFAEHEARINSLCSIQERLAEQECVAEKERDEARAECMQLRPTLLQRECDLRAATRRAEAAEHERDDLRAKLAEIKEAVAFLEKCRANREQAIETGALRDAHEWIESAAIKLARNA